MSCLEATCDGRSETNWRCIASIGFGAGMFLLACGGAEPEAEPRSLPRSFAPARPKAQAKALEPELDPAQVVLGLRGHESELHECFDLAGIEGPAFVKLAWNVTAEGEIEDLRVDTSSVAHVELGTCLTERLAQARFGRPGERRRAHWTFVGGLVRFEDAETRKRNEKRKKKREKRPDEREQGVVIERSSPGKLEAEAVEDIVQSGYRLFAHCYRDGLARDPTLGGAVRLRFVIGTDGAVARVIDGGSDLPDRGVVACVAESFFSLRFPKPRGGNVHLRYRIHFDSG